MSSGESKPPNANQHSSDQAPSLGKNLRTAAVIVALFGGVQLMRAMQHGSASDVLMGLLLFGSIVGALLARIIHQNLVVAA